LDRRFILQNHSKEIENMEFLKPMLAKMNADMNSMQEETKANQKELKEEVKANQAKTEANRKADQEHMREMLDAIMKTMQENADANQEKLLARLEANIEANQAKTDVNLKELTERIGKTQVELQTVKVSLDAQARELQEDLATIRSDHLRDYDLTHIKLQAAISESRSEIEATKYEFQSRLEVVETRAERGRGP
jgi:ABC-type Zn2+ transport system substrate-binding protein/surface adhesin